jgi:hypothetical protein
LPKKGQICSSGKEAPSPGKNDKEKLAQKYINKEEYKRRTNLSLNKAKE